MQGGVPALSSRTGNEEVGESGDWRDEDSKSIKKDLAKEPSTHDAAYVTDPVFFRLVIHFAGWVLLLSVSGMLVLGFCEKEIPQGVVATASGLVGLLAGIFSVKAGKT
jgi:hypothetical protein